MLVRYQKIRINLAVLVLLVLLFLPVLFFSIYILQAEHEDTLSRYHAATAPKLSQGVLVAAPLSDFSLVEQVSRAAFRKKVLVSLSLLVGTSVFTAFFTTYILVRRIVTPFLSIGEQVRDIGNSPDFSGRVRLEVPGEFAEITEAFNRQMDLLEQKDRQLFQSQQMELAGLMAGGMAHEFNTVLTSIKGFAHLVQKRLTGQEDNLQYVEHILGACDRGQHLTKNLMRLQRNGAVTPERLNVGDLIQEVARANAKIIGDHFSIRVMPLPEHLHVLGDRHFLYQVFMNLVANARDAMPEGGVITISADVVHVKAEDVSDGNSRRGGAYVAISLADTGVGMDEEILQRMFHPFFTTKEVGKGSGLGLSVSHAIISQHGGFINVSTEAGNGTAVVIHLPLLDEG